MIVKKTITFLAACAFVIAVMSGCNTVVRTEVNPPVSQAESSLPEYTGVSPGASDTADIPTTAASPAESSLPEYTSASPSASDTADMPITTATLAEDGVYTSKDDVALYIHLYSRLPGNFISKKQANQLGWIGGSLEQYAPGKCIGGDKFGNYEGLLPSKNGRVYTECDIDTLDATSRGAKRIVFSNDGLVYYTDDHYESFTLLYGDDST